MEPVITSHVREPNCFTLDFYLAHEGYQGLRKALAATPDQVIEIVTITPSPLAQRSYRPVNDVVYRPPRVVIASGQSERQDSGRLPF